MRKFALALALSLSTLVSTAARAETHKYERTRVVGHSAYAQWEYQNGNVGTFVAVNTSLNDDPSTTDNGNVAFVALTIDQYDMDTGNVLLTGNAYVFDASGFDFQVDHDLGTATLHVRNAIFQDDNSFTFFNVDIDLTWTATGDAYTAKSHENFKEGGYHYQSNFFGTFRDAAVTGSIYGKDTQFVQGPSEIGQLQFNKIGTITVTTNSP